MIRDVFDSLSVMSTIKDWTTRTSTNPSKMRIRIRSGHTAYKDKDLALEDRIRART